MPKFFGRHDQGNEGQEMLSASLLQSIEDAILFGRVRELDDVLKVLSVDPKFSDQMRHGIESLRYFREYYGEDGVIEPQDSLRKQKTIVLEAAWGAELLEKLRDFGNVEAVETPERRQI